MKKTLALLAVVALLCSLAIGNTLAYLKDSTAQKNTFAVGNVKIQLTEAVVKHDKTSGNIIADGTNRTDANQDFSKISNLYPAQTIVKDPTIKNIGSEKAYMAAKIFISSDNTQSMGNVNVLGLGWKNLLDTNKALKGGLMSAGTVEENGIKDDIYVYGIDGVYNIWQRIENIGGKDYYVFYLFLEGEKAPGFEQALFEQIFINKDFGNDEMKCLSNLTIEVQAFAVQTNGFANCLAAMTTAFPEHFTGLADLYIPE